MENSPITAPILLKLWPAFLVWLPMGRFFYADSEHWGSGFIPLLVWAFSIPVLGVLSAIAAVYEMVRLRKRLPQELWRPLVWAAICALYWLAFCGHIPIVS